MEAGLKKMTLYFPCFGHCLVWMLLLKGRSSLVAQLGEIAQEILLQYHAIVQSNFITTTTEGMKTPHLLTNHGCQYVPLEEASSSRASYKLCFGRTGNSCSIIRRNDWKKQGGISITS